MDFSNGTFLTELNNVRRRIVPSYNSTSSISTDSIELCPATTSNTDVENNYINLDTFRVNETRDSSIQVSRPTTTYNSLINETNVDSLGNFNLQRAFERLNKTLELNNSLVNRYNENNNTCCQTVTVMILTSAYLLGLIILNDFILLNYFINRD